MKWNDISTVPEEKIVLLRKDFDECETPLVVIGEVINMNGKVHQLYRGGYAETVNVYKTYGFEDNCFTHWAPL